MQKRWAILLVLVSWVLMGLSGFLSAFVGSLMATLIFDTYEDNPLIYHIAGWTAIVIFFIFFFVTIRQGIQAGLGAVAGFFTGAVAVVFAVIYAIGGFKAAALPGVFAIAVAGALVGAVAETIAVTEAVALAGVGAGVVAFTVAEAGAGAGAKTGNGAEAEAFAGAVAGVVLLFSTYISWRALKGDPKHALIRNIAIAFAAFRGTSFRNADLTDADFTKATLKSTDFRKATLTRTSFHKTKKLDRVRPGSSYLQIAEVCQVVMTGQGQYKNFDRLDLRGINFRGANLIKASFIGTDLSGANLQDVDLSRAKLVQAQLNGTDLTRATLTGATIEDWGITSDTKLHEVRCKYVFMRLGKNGDSDENRRRKPDNWEEVFADGEFGDFIKPIVDTLDLYHNSGVDPRAIAISFKQLAENHPDAELEIVAMEKRGEDKFLLRAKTAPEANKSQLSQEYFEIYNQLKALAEQEFKALMAEKDSRIRSLETMVVTALQRPSFYAETYQNQGYTMSQSSKKQSTFNLQNAQFGGGLVDAETVNVEQIGGNIINYAEKQNLAEAASEIQQLLTQLQNQGYSQEQAQQQAAQDLAKKADNDPTVLGKLVKWGQSLGNTAANTTVTEAAKEVFKIALRLSGIPIL